jgi:hypothetical protein
MNCKWCGCERDAPAAGPHVCDPVNVRKAALAEAVASLEETCQEVLTMTIVPQGGPSETKRIRDAIHYGVMRALTDVRVLLKRESK